jgi:hypothetical protein
MPIPGLDFGLFIAYVLPGALALYALSLLSSPLRDFLRPNIAQPSVGATLIIAALALAAGRVISVGRAVFIEPTFRVGLPFVISARTNPIPNQIVNGVVGRRSPKANN